MRWGLVVVVVSVALVACLEDKLDTEQECTDAGGHVVVAPSPPAMCEADERKVGDITSGVEGAICCAK